MGMAWHLQLAELKCTNPSPDLVRQVLQRGTKVARVVPHEDSRRLECIYNVRRAVASSGGTEAHVWQVVQHGTLFLQIRPHVLWIDRNGEVLDITPDEFELPDDFITYLESNEVFSVPLPPTAHRALVSDPVLTAVLKIKDIAHEICVKLTNEKGEIRYHPKQIERVIEDFRHFENATEQDVRCLKQCLAEFGIRLTSAE